MLRQSFHVEELESRLCLSSAGHHHHHRAHHAQHGNIGVKANPSAAVTRATILSVDSTTVAGRNLFNNTSSFADSTLFMNDLALIPPIAGSAFSAVPLPMIPPVATVLIPPIATIQIPPIATVQVPPIATILIPPVGM
jgi:hypothetical protein